MTLAKDWAPSRALSCGTTTLSKTRSAFCMIRSPIFRAIFRFSTPPRSSSTRKARISPLSVSRAKVMAKSAKVPPPIQRFSPLITQPSEVRSAVVDKPPAMSEPCSGSVRAKQPNFSKARSPGSHVSRCSGDPSLSIMPTTSSLWMPTSAESETSARVTSA